MAPAAPIAIPRSAIASAGASLTPSPTMITGRSAVVGADAADDLELVLGRLLGVDAVDAELATDALGDRAAVAGDHRDVPDALGPQPLDDPLGVGAELVGHHDHAGDVPVDRDDDVRLARSAGGGQRADADLVFREPAARA